MLRPFSGAVKYSKDFDRPAVDSIWNEIRGAADHKFAGAGDATRTARVRMGGESVNSPHNTLHNSCGGFRIFGGDVLRFLIEVLKGAA